MATEFICTIKEAGGDYSTLNSWNTANDCDLTSAATKVFSHGAITGTIADNATVTGVTSLATGVCNHCTDSQILIKTITGTFQNGEVVYETLGVNFITLTNAGDSAIATAQISGTWSAADTTGVALSSWITNSINYINIYTSTTARHTGKLNTTSAYIIDPGTNGAVPLTISSGAEYCRIDGLQLRSTRSAGGLVRGTVIDISGITTLNDVRISNCIIIESSAHLTATSAISGSPGLVLGSLKIWNNIVYQTNATASKNGISVGTSYTYNNTVYGFSGTGIASLAPNSFPTIKNNISYNNVTADYTSGGGVFTNGSFNNLSKDATSPNATFQNKTLTFADTSSGDFHLVPADTDAIGQGVNLDTGHDAILTFSNDIDGQTRVNPWDLGADAYATIRLSTLNLKTSPLPINIINSISINFYNRFKTNLLKGLVDFGGSGSHTIKAGLLTSSYTFNTDHNYWTTLSTLYETSGTGYTAGGVTLSNFFITLISGNNAAYFTCNSFSWPGSSFSARYIVLYDNTLTTKDLILCIDLGATVTTTSSGLLINIPKSGLITIY